MVIAEAKSINVPVLWHSKSDVWATEGVDELNFAFDHYDLWYQQPIWNHGSRDQPGSLRNTQAIKALANQPGGFCVIYQGLVCLRGLKRLQRLSPAAPALRCPLCRDVPPAWPSQRGRCLFERGADFKGGKTQQQSTTENTVVLPDAIFTTGSVIGSLTGTLDVFRGSTRPITPLLSWKKPHSHTIEFSCNK